MEVLGVVIWEKPPQNGLDKIGDRCHIRCCGYDRQYSLTGTLFCYIHVKWAGFPTRKQLIHTETQRTRREREREGERGREGERERGREREREGEREREREREREGERVG